MRNSKVEGVIIRRRNTGEADRILTIFTKTQGKIQVKAKGVRRITSKRSPHIELLNHSLLTLYTGKGLPFVTESETIEDYAFIKQDLFLIGAAFHICELMDSLCAENQEHPFLFTVLLQTLSKITKGENVKDTMHVFENTMLSQLGFSSQVALARTIDTHAAIEDILERKLKTTQLLTHFV